MTEPETLTIFGKAFKPHDGGPKLEAHVGVFDFYIEPAPEGFRGWISYNGREATCNGQQSTPEGSRDWLEGEAHILAREMLGMAIPLHSERKTATDILGDIARELGRL